MAYSDILAIAAHLHVLLRRKTGRVTDTEWMARNADYAAEIVRFTRSSALEDGHADLAPWADRLEAAMQPSPTPSPLHERLAQGSAKPSITPDFTASEAYRYVRGIR